MAKLIHALDIGSSKLRLIVGQLVKKSPKIVTVLERPYDGFMDSEFFDENALKFEIRTMINDMVHRTREPIKKVFIGIPSEFCLCVCKRITSCFIRPKTVSASDIELLFQQANMLDSDNYKIINFSPMKFVLDNNTEVISPIGKKTQNIIMDCSFVLAKKSLIDMLNSVVAECNIKKVEFISSGLAQSVMVQPVPQLEPIIVLDVGHITTSLTVLKGEGLAMLSSFSIGSGHITSDLMQLLKMNYSDADAIKRKAVLTIMPERNERYEIKLQDRTITALIQITNDIIRSRIEYIGQVVSNLLSVDSIYDNIPVVLTGDGLTHLKGADQILAEVLNRKVTNYGNTDSSILSKYQTSAFGILNLAVKL